VAEEDGALSLFLTSPACGGGRRAKRGGWGKSLGTLRQQLCGESPHPDPPPQRAGEGEERGSGVAEEDGTIIFLTSPACGGGCGKRATSSMSSRTSERSERRSGIHNHRPARFEWCCGNCLTNNIDRWLWVPTFAATTRCLHSRERAGTRDYATPSANPAAHSANAYAIATSSSRLKRPEAPPWPAPMLVRSSTGPPPAMVARSRAIHLAGSQ
jgi:hypothetical protein